jgi:predicted CXXCH cytochrome family protein
MRRRLAALLVCAALGVMPSEAHADISNTLHNLTPGGPGIVKNPDRVGMCRFCHTPHRAAQTLALWNRGLPDQTYDLYESSTLEATPEQPTGSSRLCLSCHDGTIALGNVLHAPGQTIAPLGPLEGRVLLGTDLSDDHPISFVFDEDLALRNGELASPFTLLGPVHLDDEGRVQCTTCHDPHEDAFPKFLVTTIENGELCISCHLKNGWSISSHANSLAQWNGNDEDPWPGSPYPTVAQNACLSCHMPHSAPYPERLLRREPEQEVCLPCHGGNVALSDVVSQLAKPSHHPVVETSGIHDPPENPLAMDRHVSCMDCHNPHAVDSAVAQAPDVSGRQRNVRGVDLSGTPIPQAQFAYEVCFKCHGLLETASPRVIRLDNTTNVRLEIHATNPSFHPVAAVGTNPNVVSLIPPLLPSSRIYCHDCHNTDEAPAPGPNTALGPHGSIQGPILEREYPLYDFVQQSSAIYALCYKCHDEVRLEDDSAFEHKNHLQNADAPCVACHDPHGSRTNTHLINFLRFDENGTEVVRPSISTGLLQFNDLGLGRGECYLTCHDVDHCPRSYDGPDKDFIGDCN